MKRKHNRVRIAVTVPPWCAEKLVALAVENLTSVQLEGGLLLEAAMVERFGQPAPRQEESQPSSSE